MKGTCDGNPWSSSPTARPDLIGPSGGRPGLPADLASQPSSPTSRVRSSWLKSLRHPVGLGDYATLAWMASSIAIVGGALGSGFDDEQAVGDAAYGYRQRERRRQQDADSVAEQGQ